MRKAMSTLVVAGAALAAVGAGVAPAQAGAQADPYANTHLVKVWGTKPGKGVYITMGDSTKSGAVAKIARCSMKSTTQIWTLKYKTADGITTIKNKKSGNCLGVASKKSGTKVKLYKCNGSKQQQWALGGNKIYSKYAGSGLVITAETSKSGQALTITKAGESNSKRIKQERTALRAHAAVGQGVEEQPRRVHHSEPRVAARPGVRR
ncbi:RICIN domain-containing protein [Streptomyces sp. KR80]|uniref:RICIN domain-containing protein n=1 Tax=Streptomyces sp. KR80 TaxID=3457426 RepID=UPI003FD68683